MKKVVSLFLLICLFSVVGAEYKYDYKTGNSYNTTKNYDGSTTVRGRNLQTGSTWKTTIESDGDMKGTDSDGNRWKYNSSNKTYLNYGTGEMRRSGKCYINCD